MKGVFLQLVRLGIGTASEAVIPDNVDWPGLQDLAERQGLLAVVLDGLDKLPPSSYDMPRSLKKQWIGEVMHDYEYRYELYQQAIAEMAAFYNAHGFKMMVLKGYACSLDWPRPDHRPCGDIDIWQFGQQAAADAALAKERGVKIDNSHHHHTIFSWREFTVENHYDFIDVHHRKSGPKLEAIFKEMGQDDSNRVEVGGETVCLPSVNLHALFLMYHLMLHFTSTEMNIRQILDWALFVKKHTAEIDWPWLIGLVKEFHIYEFFNIINAIGISDLGFDASIFPAGQCDLVLKDRVLKDTFTPEFSGQEPSGLLRRIWFRYRRWKNHEWKHRRCFSESMWSIFWRSVWSHILKPGSI